MGVPMWFYNFTQWPTKRPTVKDLDDIPYPYIELGLFTTFKTLEIGSFVGGCIINPIYYRYHLRHMNPLTSTRNTPRQILKTARLLGFRCALGGLFAGPIVHIIHCAIKGYKNHELYDMCYRLRFNKKQLHIDRSVIFCGMPGLYAYKSFGWVIGMNFGLIASIFYNTLLWEHSYQLLEDRAATIPDEYEEKKEKREKEANLIEDTTSSVWTQAVRNIAEQ